MSPKYCDDILSNVRRHVLRMLNDIIDETLLIDVRYFCCMLMIFARHVYESHWNCAASFNQMSSKDRSPQHFVNIPSANYYQQHCSQTLLKSRQDLIGMSLKCRVQCSTTFCQPLFELYVKHISKHQRRNVDDDWLNFREEMLRGHVVEMSTKLRRHLVHILLKIHVKGSTGSRLDIFGASLKIDNNTLKFRCLSEISSRSRRHVARICERRNEKTYHRQIPLRIWFGVLWNWTMSSKRRNVHA